MKINKLFSYSFLILLLVSVSVSAGEDPNIPDTIYIESAFTASNNNGFVPVYFSNDENLAGIELTLTYDSPDIFIDSFSFVGGRLESYLMKNAQPLTSNSITISNFVLDEPLIEAGSGLMGYLFFSFIPNISPQVISIDTMTLLIGDRSYSTTFSDEAANTFAPVFIEGQLSIQTNSCCLGDRGNIDNSPDDVVDISDLLFFIDFMFAVDGPKPVCEAEANINGSIDEQVDISDFLMLVDYMFTLDGTPPASCP